MSHDRKEDQQEVQEEVDRRVREERKRHVPEEGTTLLNYRGKKRRRRPRPEFEVLPGGGVLYEDVLPVPAREVPESNVVRYVGYEFDWSDL